MGREKDPIWQRPETRKHIIKEYKDINEDI